MTTNTNQLLFITGLLIFLIAWALPTTGQYTKRPAHQDTTTYINLFQYGSPLTAAEINFNNFQDNLPLSLINADAIKIDTIVFEGKIKNAQHAKEILQHNIQHGAPAWGLISVIDASIEDCSFKLETSTRINGEKENIPLIIDEILPHIRVDDLIYRFTLIDTDALKETDSLKFDYYIFVNSRTNQVIKKGNMLAFEIPLEFLKMRRINIE